MKQNLPYNILLAVTVLITGMVVYCNLVLRKAYTVEVRYDYPSAQATQLTGEQRPPSGQGGERDGKASVVGHIGEIIPEYDEFYEEPDEDEIVVRFPLNLNRATYDELILIPKIGDVTAQRILQYRAALGAYEDLEQLMDIKGIGEATYDSIAPYLYVGDGWDLQMNGGNGVDQN